MAHGGSLPQRSFAVGAERRRHIRFALAVPARVRVHHHASPIETSTLDISASGLFLTLPEAPDLGGRVDCQLDLPDLLEGSPVPLHCTGRIVRIERRDGRIGVAVHVERYEFERHKN